MKNPMEKHESFILDTLLPMLANQSRAVNAPMGETAMAVFLALGTVLQSTGVSDQALIAAIKASKPDTHPGPERLQ